MIVKLLKFLDAERAHDIAKFGMKNRLLAPGPYIAKVRMFGTVLINNVGLAAGFDKNGELVDVINDYGFGWVEVGSVTYRGGVGNQKPRMYRIDDRHIANRMGLNGDPASVVYGRLANCKSNNFAINIAKTHDPSIIGDAAIEDVSKTYGLFCTMGLYNVINISCPNTAEGKTFEEIESLGELLAELYNVKQYAFERTGLSVPLLIKISPGFDNLEKLMDLCSTYGVSGVVCSNTKPMTLNNVYKTGDVVKCGMSGPALLSNVVQQVAAIKALNPSMTVIACGGMSSHDDYIRFMDAGANFVQAYCGFVSGPNAGPNFVHKIKPISSLTY